MLGRVNPLALEEFSAMEERHKFLTEQLEDLKKTRKDLLDIVREVDQRVEQVFTEAWEDVRVAFDHVFKRLFPGGEGKLVLTDPGDMLNTGIEVEARPAGKKVKRLRSEEHTSELQSLMRISYAVFCLKKKKTK